MHCKDTILRTQNNWPYSKFIPNSGLLYFSCILMIVSLKKYLDGGTFADCLADTFVLLETLEAAFGE